MASATCSPTCSDPGSYGDKTDQTCKSCHEYCLTCTGGLEIECEPNSCTPGNYYVDTITPTTCGKCDSKCSSCTGSATNCQSCNYPYFFTGSSCNDKCPDFYYKNVADLICEPCGAEAHCLTCKDSTNTGCLSCSKGYFMNSASEC